MGIDQKLTGVPEFNTLELIKTGSITVTKAANSSGASTELSHNLGYIPIILAFFEFNPGAGALQIPLPYSVITAGGLVSNYMEVYINATTITLALTAPNLGGGSPYTTAQTFTARYYLLRQVAR